MPRSSCGSLERKQPNELRLKSLFSQTRNDKNDRLEIAQIFRQSNFVLTNHCKYTLRITKNAFSSSFTVDRFAFFL